MWISDFNILLTMIHLIRVCIGFYSVLIAAAAKTNIKILAAALNRVQLLIKTIPFQDLISLNYQRKIFFQTYRNKMLTVLIWIVPVQYLIYNLFNWSNCSCSSYNLESTSEPYIVFMAFRPKHLLMWIFHNCSGKHLMKILNYKENF